MGISYDPSKSPEFDPAALNEAMQLGLIPINVVCDEPGRQPGDAGGVSFVAYVEAVPRVGERIVLQDDTTCEVRRVYHVAVRPPGSRVTTLRINVSAVRVGPESDV